MSHLKIIEVVSKGHMKDLLLGKLGTIWAPKRVIMVIDYKAFDEKINPQVHSISQEKNEWNIFKKKNNTT